MTVTTGGQPRRIDVPVEMPEGVSYEGVFGSEKREIGARPMAAAMSLTTIGGARAVQESPRVSMDAASVYREPQKVSKIDPALNGKTGKLEVRVWLTDTSAQTIEQLKKLGLEILLQPKTAKLVIGRIAAEKLAALAELKVVRHVAGV